MNWIQRLARRLRTLTRLASVETSMDREMRAHIDLEIEERVARGATPDDARAAVLRDFGSIETLKEHGRDARGTRVVEDFLRDTAHAVRMLAHQRTFSISVILTFGLGIGAATAIFSVVYGVLLRPLPYAHPQELLTLWEHNVPRAVERNVVSVANFEAWRSRATSFDSIAALVPAPVTLPSPDGPERLVGAEVSPGYFDLLGVRPMLGRAFAPGDGTGVVILSEEYWRTRMGADPAIVGKTLALGGRPHDGDKPHEIIGVMPADFEPPAFGWLARKQTLWVPFVPGPENRQYGRYLLLIARLRDGVTAGAARAELVSIASGLEQESPANAGWSANIVPLAEQITGDVRTPLAYILGTVALLLVLAVTNVSTLLLARTRRRMHELGLRRALGATDARLHRQLITECLLLGAVGCAAGVAAAFPLVTALVSQMPVDVPRTGAIRLDGTVLAFSAAGSLAASLIVGIIAARRGRRAPSVLLRESASRSSTRGSGRALVVAEVAIGLVVAVLAGLVIRSFISLRDVALGFETDGVVVGRVALGARFDTPDAQRAFFDELLARVRQQDGVRHAGIFSGRPFGGIGPATTVRDAAAQPTMTDVIADGRWADAEALRALQIRLIAGGLFDADDRPDAPARIVINQSMARALWHGADAVGRTAALDLFNGLTATVIGVVADIHLADSRTPARPGFYLAPSRFGGEAYDLIVRSDAPLPAVMAAMRQTLAGMDASIPLHRLEAMDDAVGRALATDRFVAVLLSSFAALALLLASVGIYGVFAGDVAARRKEIGIRIALGAGSRRVLMEIVGRAFGSAIIGIVLGGAAAALLARSMQTLLFGVETTDVYSFALAGMSVLAVTLAATIIPAAHAARVSPLLIIRGE